MHKIITLFLCLALFQSVRASHEAAGQISVKQLNTTQFQVKVILWVDSLGLPAPNLYYKIQGPSGLVNDTANQVSDVSVGDQIQQRTYLDTITLSAPGAYKLIHSNCCRNPAIVNLSNPAMDFFYLYCDFNYATAVTNSTPEFINPPLFFVGVNDTMIHQPLAVDPDGDSLAFTWANPLTNNGNAAMMTMNPYPALVGWPFTIDPNWGEITWLPNVTGRFAYDIKVQEFRNGILLSTSHRTAFVNTCAACKVAMTSEFQYNNVNTWPQPINHFEFVAYANQPFSWTYSGAVPSINANALDLKLIGDQTFFNNPPTFSPVQSGSSIGGTYTWTPTTAQIRNRQYLNAIIGKETNAINQVRRKEHTMLFRVSGGTAVDDEMKNVVLDVYPNPANGNLFLQCRNTDGDFNNVQILNAIGQRVFETQLNTGVHVVTLDVTTWPVGNYIVKLTGNKSYTTRILVQH